MNSSKSQQKSKIIQIPIPTKLFQPISREFMKFCKKSKFSKFLQCRSRSKSKSTKIIQVPIPPNSNQLQPISIEFAEFCKTIPNFNFSEFLQFRFRPLHSIALGASISMAVLPRPETIKIKRFLKIFETLKNRVFDGCLGSLCHGVIKNMSE